jgi:hypothetical protein
MGPHPEPLAGKWFPQRGFLPLYLGVGSNNATACCFWANTISEGCSRFQNLFLSHGLVQEDWGQDFEIHLNPLGDHVFKTKLGYTRFWDTHDSPWHERIYWIKSAKNHPDIEITGTLFPATFSHNMNQLSKQNAPKRVRQYITPLDVPIT